MKYVLLVVAVAMFTSCNRGNVVYDKPYFDFDSLVNHQVSRFQHLDERVVKKINLDGKTDSSSFVPDTVQWRQELDAFEQLDVINKPLYKGNYDLVVADDVHSNLQVNTYSIAVQSNLKSPVPEVKFYFLEHPRKLKRIESVFKEKNVLFSTVRKLTLEFEQLDGVAMISRYRVEGFQKMVLSDTVRFRIEGIVNYP